MTETYLYRYRSKAALLEKFEELQSQSIYFASAAQLNDPMEGFQNTFWQGDLILWKNLIRHYLLCLMQFVPIVQIMADDFKRDAFVNVLDWSHSNLPTQALKDNHESICAAFFEEEGIVECLAIIATTRERVHRDELAFYLSAFHPIALHHVLQRLRERGLMPPTAGAPFPQSLVGQTSRRIKQMLQAIQTAQTSEREFISMMFETGGRALDQVALLAVLNHEGEFKAGWRFLTVEFSDFYCRNISLTLYPSWYAACFVGTPTHAAMWAHYGDRQEGMCLKFRAETDDDGAIFLNLTGVAGRTYSNGEVKPIISRRRFRVAKVDYVTSFPEVDFFRSLGRIPIPTLNRDWYSDDGILSETARTVFKDEARWREDYWAKFQAINTAKFDDWKHEDERRATINGFLDKEIDGKERLFRYDFSDLVGIIFGMNTPMDSKLEVMRIIERKCREENRRDFEFLQAVYSSETKKIDVVQMHLLKIS